MGAYDAVLKAFSFVRGRTPFSGVYGSGSFGSSRRYTYFLPGQNYDYGPLVRMGLWRNATVAAGIDWLARNWNVPHLQVVRVDESGIETPVPQHPALALLRRPHPSIGMTAFTGSVVRDLITRDTVWIEKVKNRIGEVTELRYWRADRVAPLYPMDGSEYLSGWRYQVNGRNYDVPSSRVIFVRRYMSVEEDRYGWCPLQESVREIAALNEAATYTASVLRNMGIPGMVMVPKGEFTISDADAEGVKARMDDVVGGENRGSTAVLTGPMDIHKVSFSPEELGLNEIPKQLRSQVLAVMGLNPDVLGLNTDQSGAYGSYAEAIRAAYVHGLMPLQALWADELTHQLLVEFEDEDDVRNGRIKFSWDYSPVEELDDREQIAANRAIRLFAGGITTLNESRDIVGYGPSDAKDADTLGLDRETIRMEAGVTGPAAKVSEGDALGGVRVPASSGERSKIEGERNTDPLSPSRSKVNKSSFLDVISQTPEPDGPLAGHAQVDDVTESPVYEQEIEPCTT